MAIDYYGKKTSLINPYGSSSGNTEASMRDEMIDTLEGKYPEIAKGQTHLFRKMRRTSSGGLVPCPCVDVTTNEPDKDRFCPICYGEGNLFDESYILLYRILVAPDYGNSVRDKILPPGILNVPLAIFYTRYDELITEQDKIVLVNQNLDGTVVTPVRRRELYKIAAAWDYRADNGKLEYWKLFVHKEVVKYMNPPGFDTTTNDL